jgi:hypothetical protein
MPEVIQREPEKDREVGLHTSTGFSCLKAAGNVSCRTAWTARSRPSRGSTRKCRGTETEGV